MLSEDVDLAKVWEAVGGCSYVFMPFCLFLRFASCRAVLAIVAFLFLFHLLSMVYFLVWLMVAMSFFFFCIRLRCIAWSHIA